MGCGQTLLKGREIASVQPKERYDIRSRTIIKYKEGLVSQDQLVADEAKAFLYSCMDFRLLDDIVYFMNLIGYNNNYDQFILGGGSLAFASEKFKNWRKIGKEHLDLGIKLHKIKEIICIDHEKCGAYKYCYPDMKPEEEKQKHIENMTIFEKKFKKSHPEIEVHCYYMYLTGSVEKIN